MEKHISASIAAAVGAVLLLIIVFGSWYTVDQGSRGVILRNGAIVGEAEPGIHFKLPIFDSVVRVTLQEFTLTYNKVQAYSKDQQPAVLKVSVTAKITDPSSTYANYGGQDGFAMRIVNPRVYQQVENIFGQYDAVHAVQDRVALSRDLLSGIQAAITGPINILSVQIENLDFSDAYEKAVESRMQATVQQQQAEAEKAKRITNADAAAYEVRVAADAEAHRTDIVGAAEAGAIKKRGDALKDNPGLVSLTAAERWNGILPTTMVPNGATPFVSVGK